MKYILKNTKAYLLIGLFYVGGIGALILPFLDIAQRYHKNPLGVWTVFIFCIVMFQITLKALPVVTFELVIFNNEIIIKKWNYFFLKEYRFTSGNIEKITVNYGPFQKSQLTLHVLNSKKISMDLNYINYVEATLPSVELNQYAPNVEKLRFTLSVAKLMSNQLNIPFESEYI